MGIWLINLYNGDVYLMDMDEQFGGGTKNFTMENGETFVAHHVKQWLLQDFLDDIMKVIK